ncbi:HAD-IA family hydrolase [Niveibacterium umoris]|uniref:Phosphoglycolate phosphatase n=1 Tax=Niveibacterium umoris TaxID=1193620 RepID=A0A840BDV9_9RHOO|nr:HAD-IIIA family hydrolase [Niveibacterium umoris]MBB4010883.1 phosphoglycolate phosphatase [Niveibacterium umoris]
MAERRFDLIVFDWDGTLMDSTASIVSAIQAACADLGLPVPTREAASHVIGLGLSDALHTAVPELDPADYPRMVERYRYHYFARDGQLVLFDGAEELVSQLRAAGYMLAIATGKSRAGLDRALASTGIGPLFQGSRTADETHSKPHPAMLLELMDEFAVPAARVLMVGDTTHDLQMAQNAGTAALGVSYGAHPAEQLVAAAPLALLHSVAELGEWLAANA